LQNKGLCRFLAVPRWRGIASGLPRGYHRKKNRAVFPTDRESHSSAAQTFQTVEVQVVTSRRTAGLGLDGQWPAANRSGFPGQVGDDQRRTVVFLKHP